MELGSTIKFKPDTSLRKRFMVSEAFSHPAKMHIGMLFEIAARYKLQPGSWVLDCMAGSGTGMFLAQLGINVCLIELEGHFVLPMRASWEKMRQHGPMLGCTLGDVVIIRGDARCLPLGRVDAAVFSPPYEEGLGHGTAAGEQIMSAKGISNNGRAAYTRPPVDAAVFSPPFQDQTILHDLEFTFPDHTKKSGQVYSRYTRPSVDAIVTSPPYEESISRWSSKKGILGAEKHIGGGFGNYTRPSAIITSPPYEGSIQGEPGVDFTKMQRNGGPHTQSQLAGGHRDMTVEASHTTRLASLSGYTRPSAIIPSPPYGQAPENVGNMKGSKYWEAMTQIYRECHRVLADEGIMVLILKGFTRDHVYQDLPQQTVDLVETLGFELFDRWQREVWTLSFWRTLQKKNNPDSWDERLRFEDVLAFRKCQR